MSVVSDSGAHEGDLTSVELHEQPYGEFSTVNEETGILSGRRSSGIRQPSSCCERLCSCCYTTRRVIPNSVQDTPIPGRSSWNCHNIWNSCFILAIFVGVYFLNQHQQNQIILLEKEIGSLRHDYESSVLYISANISALHAWELAYQRDTKHEFNRFSNIITGVSDTLADQQRQLTRLSNGTSNADVLDKLRETTAQVNDHLNREQEAFNKALTESSESVSRRLVQNSRELMAAKENVELTLNKTVGYMQTVVGQASMHISSLQVNMTNEIDAMTLQVHSIVDKLGEQVKNAENTIHEEVEAVQNNIAQYVAVTDKQFAAENDFVKYQLAGTFTLLACLISLWHLTSHLRHYYKPDVQRRIMAVLWMVPIYSITSWLSLVWPNLESYLAALRDIYEAYAVYTFIGLLIAVLEDGRGLNGMINHLTQRVVEERDALAEYERLVAERAPTWSFFAYGTSWVSGSGSGESRLPPKPVEHIVPPFPCCYRVLRPITVAAAWLYQCQLMAMQFVIMRPVLTIIPIILKDTGVCDVTAAPIYVDGAINWLAPNLYILFITNVSVAIAFYGLLSFYHGTEKDLEWCEPWPKFLCIKGVVFCTFWQSLTIQFLSTAGRMDNHSAAQIQNLLICIEMFIASIAHFYIFPYEEWKDDYKREKEKGIMLKDTLALRDFVKDMSLMVTSWNTEVDMDMLSEERAKLTTELHSLKSGSRHGSASRRNSHSRSQSINGSPTSVSPSDSPYIGRGSGVGSGGLSTSGGIDIERGIGYNHTTSGLNLAAFSFDLIGSGLLHRGDDDAEIIPNQEQDRWDRTSFGSVGVVASGREGSLERAPLNRYQSQQLASRGMRRQASTDIAHGSGVAPFTQSSSTRPSFDRAESVRHALLQKLQALSVDENSTQHQAPKERGQQRNIEEKASNTTAGKESTIDTFALARGVEELAGVLDVEKGTEENAKLPLEQSVSSVNFADRYPLQQQEPNTHLRGNLSRFHADSLTFSPDSSGVIVYPADLAHTSSDLKGGRILFPGGESFGESRPPQLQESLESVLESQGAVIVDDDQEDVSSIESNADVQNQHEKVRRYGGGREDVQNPGGISAGSDSSVFRDVRTPTPNTQASLVEISPLPDHGAGTWKAVSGVRPSSRSHIKSAEISPVPDGEAGTLVAGPSTKNAEVRRGDSVGSDDESDQSTYAV